MTAGGDLRAFDYEGWIDDWDAAELVEPIEGLPKEYFAGIICVAN